MESFESCHIQEVCPITSLDESSIEFEFESSIESEFEITDGKCFYLDVATPDTKPSDYYTIDARLYPSISDILNEMNKEFKKGKSMRNSNQIKSQQNYTDNITMSTQ